MPRLYGPFIHQVYIAHGFADDCEELVQRCLEMENFNFQGFCSVWRDMNMGCAYEGRTLGAEIAEVSEEFIRIGKHYMLKDTSNFEESAIGVFMVYALLNLQPYKGFAHLRIVPEDLPAINRIEYVARRDKRYEVLYALGSILIKGPVEYHAADREYGIELAIRKYLEGFTCIDKMGVRPKGVFRKQNEESDILKELDTLTKQYENAKNSVPGTFKLGAKLSYIDVNLASDLQSQLLRTISGIHGDKYEMTAFLNMCTHHGNQSDSNNVEDKTLISRRAIKEKAMKEDVKPVRHLVNLNNIKTHETSNKGKSPKKKSKSKIKQEKSPSESKASHKRRIAISPRALKKKSRKRIETDDDEGVLSANDIDINDKPSTDEDNDVESIPLSERIKAAAIAATKKKNLDVPAPDLEKIDDNNTMTCDPENEQAVDIKIDNMPVFLRTENLFEIEFIDKLKEKPEPVQQRPPLKTYKRKESALTKVNAMPGVSITKKPDSAEATEPIPSTSSAIDFARIIGNNDKDINNGPEVDKTVENVKEGLGKQCAKLEKRDCKRVHLQSKFKRLGMLPVANFKSPEVLTTNRSDEEDTGEDSQGSTGLMPIED